MAVHAANRAARIARTRRAVAAKERRQRLLLAGCSVLFAIVLGVEVLPMLTKRSGGTQTPSPATNSQPSAAATTPAGEPATGSSANSPRIRSLAPKDPFVAQVSTPPPASTAAATDTSPGRGPAVRERRFVAKDPFLQQVVASGTTTSGSAGPSTTSRPAAPTSAAPPVPASIPPSLRAAPVHGSVVVVASTPIAQGQAAAIRAAVAAQNEGLVDVKVSRFARPNGSVFLVYTGPYARTATARSDLRRALGVGYGRAYTAPAGAAATAPAREH